MNDVAKKQGTAVLATDAATIMDVIAKASKDPNVDIERMERLLAMWRSEKDREAEREFNSAFADMQAEMPVITEDAKIEVKGQTRSMYATFEAINEIVKPILQKHGFAVTFQVANDNSLITVTGTLLHKAGHSRSTSLPLPSDDSGYKNIVQQIGSSVSYGKRYVMSALLNITTKGEDDDARGATKNVDEVKISPVRLRKIVDGMLACTEADDGPGLVQIVDELDQAEQMYVWGQLRSWERSAIKKVLLPARVAANDKTDPNYIDPLPE